MDGTLASPEMQQRQRRNNARELTAEERDGIAKGTLLCCDCCGEVFPPAWSDEEAATEFERNFGRPRDNTDRVVCDPCYQEMAGKLRLEK